MDQTTFRAYRRRSDRGESVKVPPEYLRELLDAWAAWYAAGSP